MRKKITLFLIYFVLMAVVLAACADPAPTPAAAPPVEAVQGESEFPGPISGLAPAGDEGDRMLVVATTSLIGDVVANVGGDAVQVIVLMEPGSDPHTYEPTPRDLASISEAGLVFVNGFGLEETLLDTLRQTAGQVPVVSISEGLAPRTVAGTGETGADPHIWMDPTQVMGWARNAELALARRDPARAEFYKFNAAAYIALLDSLDAWILAQVDRIPEGDRRLVTDHDSLGYFADRYDFQVVGAVIPAYSTTAEPSAQEIAALQDLIQSQGVKAIFIDAAFNPTLAQRLAEDTGVALLPLYTGALSGPDGPAPTYLDLMRTNVEAIVAGLIGEG